MYKAVVVFLVILSGLLIIACDDSDPVSVSNDDPLKYDTESYEKKMEWFKNSKFGIMVHWGPATVAGVDIGWGRHCYVPEQRDTLEWRPGKMVSREEYDSLYLKFNPVDFNANEWLGLVKEAGAKYFVFVTKHHDGFCLFDNDYTNYSITNENSPYGKDIVKQIADACHDNDIKLGWYYSQRDWYDPYYFTDQHGKYVEMLHAHVEQLMTDYGKTDLLWFDGYIFNQKVWEPEILLEKMRKINPDIIINNRLDPAFADYHTPEGHVPDYLPGYWEAVLSIGEQWSWKPNQKILTSNEIIKLLCKSAGNNGNLLLNITPDSYGRIEQNQQTALQETGQWLNNYGEAIYDTKSGPFISDHSWLVSTQKDSSIYLMLLNNKETDIEVPLVLPEEFKGFTVMTEHSVSVVNENNKLLIKEISENLQLPLIIKLSYTAELSKNYLMKVKL